MDYILKAKLACLSTDEKPTSIPGYTNDLKYSVLWELDTDKKYYYTGEEWVEIGSGGGGEDYLLNKTATGAWINEGGGLYYYEFSESDYNAEQLAALNTAISGGATPSLILTCPEFSISEAEIPYEDSYEWMSETAVIGVYDGGYYVGILSQNIGETKEATITLSIAGAAGE